MIHQNIVTISDIFLRIACDFFKCIIPNRFYFIQFSRSQNANKRNYRRSIPFHRIHFLGKISKEKRTFSKRLKQCMILIL